MSTTYEFFLQLWQPREGCKKSSFMYEWRIEDPRFKHVLWLRQCVLKKSNGAMSFHNVSKKKNVLGSTFGGFILTWGTMSASAKHIPKALWHGTDRSNIFRNLPQMVHFHPSGKCKKQDLRLHCWQKQLAWTPSAESIHFSFYATPHCHWAVGRAKIFSFWYYHQLQQPCDMLGQNFDLVWRLCEAQFSLIQFASHSKCESISILEFKKTHWFWIISNKESQDTSIF